MEGFPADLDVHGEVRPDVEGRVDVDGLQPAGVLDLAAQRAGLEGGEDELVIAPDEFVGPALGLAAAHVEEVGLERGTCGRDAHTPWLVDVLQRLEGQDGGANVTGFTIPDQLDLALLELGQVVVFSG